MNPDEKNIEIVEEAIANNKVCSTLNSNPKHL
jgi:hypothetical protein